MDQGRRQATEQFTGLLSKRDDDHKSDLKEVFLVGEQRPCQGRHGEAVSPDRADVQHVLAVYLAGG